MEIQLPKLSGGKDEVTGVVDATVHYWVSTLAEVWTSGAATFFGAPLVRRDFASWSDGGDSTGYQVDCKYEGLAEDEQEGAERWRFDNAIKEVPIEEHPYLGALMKKYGGRIIDGKVVWPHYVDGAGDLQLGLSRSGETQEYHPLMGKKAILVWHSVAYREYWSSSLDAVYSNVGEVFDQLPGEGPRISFDHGQNWIKRSPQPEGSGDGWMVREEYWLSMPGGWKEGVDSLIVK